MTEQKKGWGQSTAVATIDQNSLRNAMFNKEIREASAQGKGITIRGGKIKPGEPLEEKICKNCSEIFTINKEFCSPQCCKEYRENRR